MQILYDIKSCSIDRLTVCKYCIWCEFIPLQRQCTDFFSLTCIFHKHRQVSTLSAESRLTGEIRAPFTQRGIVAPLLRIGGLYKHYRGVMGCHGCPASEPAAEVVAPNWRWQDGTEHAAFNPQPGVLKSSLAPYPPSRRPPHNGGKWLLFPCYSIAAVLHHPCVERATVWPVKSCKALIYYQKLHFWFFINCKNRRWLCECSGWRCGQYDNDSMFFTR